MTRRDPSLIQCSFEDPKPEGEKRKRGGGAAKVAALEAKIAELEEKLAARPSTTGPAELPTPSPSTTAGMGDYSTGAFPLDPMLLANTGPVDFDSLLNGIQPLLSPNSYPQPPNGLACTLSTSSSSPNFSPSGFGLAPRNGAYPASPPDVDPLLQLFYPGWDSTLPSPTLVTRLIDKYFALSHLASGMIDRARFLANLSLPPTHHQFPPSCLLHAMLATAARLVSDDFFAGENEYWRRGDNAVRHPAEYHAARAKAGIEEALKTGYRLFQTAQAIVLICHEAYAAARFVEVWLFTGMATRIITPLGLNHVRNVSATDSSTAYVKPDMIPATEDPVELHERAATCWMAAALDTFATASTGWACSLAEEDITTLLPPASGVYPREDLMSSPLSPQNPSFLVAHPPHLVEELQLFLKSTVLLRRVNVFMQRAPAPVGKGPAPTASEHGSTLDIRLTPGHRKLDAEADTFKRSIPREYRTAEAMMRDSRLFLVHALAHTATILLHESSASAESGCPSLAKAMESARAILDAMYELLGTAYDLQQLPPFINYCWVVAGRTLVRDLAIRQSQNRLDGVASVSLSNDIANLVHAMRLHRCPCAESSAKALEALVAQPELCLPRRWDLQGKGTGSFTALMRYDCGGPDQLFEEGRRGAGASPGQTVAGSAGMPATERSFSSSTGQTSPPGYPSSNDLSSLLSSAGVYSDKSGSSTSSPFGGMTSDELNAILGTTLPAQGTVTQPPLTGNGVPSPLGRLNEENRFAELGSFGTGAGTGMEGVTWQT